jgi:hypothetical protein
MIGVQYDSTAATAICKNLNAVGICSPNFGLTELGSRTMWNPVPDLDVGVDVVWYHMNTAFGGSVLNMAALGAKPAGQYAVSNLDAIAGVFRIQRNFLY